MSVTGKAANIREQAPRQASSKPEPPRSNRLAKLRLHVANIYRLTIKEMRSIRSDPIMLALIAYSFTFAIYAAATGASTEATNLSVGIVDRPFRPVAAHCGWPHAAHVQAGGANRSDGNRRRDGFATLHVRH